MRKGRGESTVSTLGVVDWLDFSCLSCHVIRTNLNRKFNLASYVSVTSAAYDPWGVLVCFSRSTLVPRREHNLFIIRP